ncbi:MAG TPA: hypothetical protein DEP99_01200 [Nitrospiraceae bacterium]|nr:hypothetical protein [Nitrospiraceae bacterium]
MYKNPDQLGQDSWQSDKITILFEMFIKSKCFTYFLGLHNRKTCAVGEAEIFISILFENLERLVLDNRRYISPESCVITRYMITQASENTTNYAVFRYNRLYLRFFLKTYLLVRFLGHVSPSFLLSQE